MVRKPGCRASPWNVAPSYPNFMARRDTSRDSSRYIEASSSVRPDARGAGRPRRTEERRERRCGRAGYEELRSFAARPGCPLSDWDDAYKRAMHGADVLANA